MKHMKRLLTVFLGSMLLFQMAARAQKTIIQDPNAEVRTLTGYHAIEISDGFELYLSQSDQEAVAVSAKDAKVRAKIRTVVENGVLKISLDRPAVRWDIGNKKLKAYVAFSALDRLQASGACNVYVDGVITGNDFVLHLSGASDFKGAVRLSRSLQIHQSGASDIQITGYVSGMATLHSSGASELKGYELAADSCSATASGASDIRITVNKDLSAEASGASSIYYKGSAVISNVKASGASSVSKKG
jgi:hypothetical protein